MILCRCPVYYNLPTDCTLVRQTGECCLKPVCNFHQKIVATESSGKGSTPSGISKNFGKQFMTGLEGGSAKSSPQAPE